MAKTLCPGCGYSPIPEGAEACPVCNEPFTFLPEHKRRKRDLRALVRQEEDEATATVMGGTLVTSALGIHPGQAVAVFVAGALAWAARAPGLLGPRGTPGWLWALVVAWLVAALMLVLSRGPAKLVAQLVAVACALVALFLAIPDLLRPAPVFYAAHGLVALWMVSGEPGLWRRWAGLGMGLAFAGAAVAALMVLDGAAALGWSAQR